MDAPAGRRRGGAEVEPWNGRPVGRDRQDRPRDEVAEGRGTPIDVPADEIAIARVIGDVWLSNLVAWVTRRASADAVSHPLELAARLLLR